MSEKEKNKIDYSVIWVLLLVLVAAALLIGGLVIVLKNLFIPEMDTMFEGIIYSSSGIIISLVLALMVAYQKTIEQMNEYISQARKLIEKSQKHQPQSPFSSMMFFGGMPGDMDPSQMSEYRRKAMKQYMGYQDELKDMSIVELQDELEKSEKEENFERAAAVRDEIHRREEEDNSNS